MAKNEHITALAGAVDSIVGLAGNVVDEARKNIDKVDEYVTKGAVVLTRLVDSLENLTESTTNEPTGSPTADFAFGELLKKGFRSEYLKTLDINALINLFNTAGKHYGTWAEGNR